MGVKFGKRVTRESAEKRYADAHVIIRSASRRRKLGQRTEHLEITDHGSSRHSDELRDLPTKALIEAYILVDLALREERYRNEARHKVIEMSDETLERELESINDEAHDGEGFESYTIVPAHMIEDDL